MDDYAKRRYLKGGGVRCPYCGSEQIEGSSVDVEWKHCYQDVNCLNCKKKWQDIYTLTNVCGEE